jgi:hypothetical protein
VLVMAQGFSMALHAEEVLFSIHQIPSSRSAGGFGANVSAGGRISIAQAANHQ